MERTMISFNVPNLITVPIMAFLGFLILALAWQLFQRATGGSADQTNAGAG